MCLSYHHGWIDARSQGHNLALQKDRLPANRAKNDAMTERSGIAKPQIRPQMIVEAMAAVLGFWAPRRRF
jgi:hypothetical protein